ncbi:MAG: helix-turn-helix transcriptional regulator [Rhodobacteraceae bacterium]|nr:helix-turn-helix transcriptional regulator [Paracoccaceae bacterium]
MPQSKRLPKNSVYRALNALGDRWSLLIVQEAFLGISQFKDFHAKSGMARSTLANRLRALVKNKILEQRPQRDGMARQEYFLTERGRDLFGSVLLAWGWGVKWGMTNRNMPTALIHTSCGKPMIPQMSCTKCNESVSLHNCTYESGPGAGSERVPLQRMHRVRYSQEQEWSADVVDFTGDRWTASVIATQYFGIHRFDDIQSYLGIATNILTDRLRSLEASGILERRLYELVPPRYEYWLTKKGIDTYPHSLSLMFWGDRWLAGPQGAPVHVFHKPCGHKLGATVVCGECKQPLTIETVTAGRFRTLKSPD